MCVDNVIKALPEEEGEPHMDMTSHPESLPQAVASQLQCQLSTLFTAIQRTLKTLLHDICLLGVSQQTVLLPI